METGEDGRPRQPAMDHSTKPSRQQKQEPRWLGSTSPSRIALIPPLSLARWLLVLVIAAGVYFFHGFLVPVLAALVIGFASWPVYRDILRRCGGNRARAALSVDDPCWRMPLWKGYESQMDGDISDMSNTGSGPMAGSITAALFLKRFVDAPVWMHMDIFAWNPKARPGRPLGGEMLGARAVWEVLKARYGGARD